MIFKIEWRVEGLDPDGNWRLLDRPLGREGDHLGHRDHVVRTLRDMKVSRYSKVRLVKYVTTIEVVGEDVSV